MSEIRRAVVKSYDAAAHKADVQIAGSLAVWLDAVRVATNIPAADVVTGRQCTVLFLDPSNQDDAVIITIQGALPSTGELLVATATATLTLTTSRQSIVGDGDSSKVRLLLPTPGDWLIEATCDFHVTTAAAGFAAIGELLLNDSASPESGAAIKEQQALDRATVTQRWKVTTAAADTPVELKARKDGGAGVVVASATHTRLTALLLIGGNATSIDPSATVVTETAFGQADAAGSATPYSRGDHTHGTPADPVPAHAAIVDAHAMLAAANTWAALQTFSAGLQLAAAQAIKDSGGTARIAVSASAPFVKVTGDPTTPTRAFEVANIAASTGDATSAPGFVVDFASGKAVCLTAGGSQSVFMFDDAGAFAVQKRPRADVLLGIGSTGGAVFEVNASGLAGVHLGSTGPSYPWHILGSALPQLYIDGGGSHAQAAIVGGGVGTEKGLDYKNLTTLLWKAGIDNLPSSPDFRASYVIKQTNNANPEFAVTPSGNFIMADAGATSLPSASTLLELQSTTAALLLTRMTTTQRNALTAVNGMIIYNTTDNVVQAYENGAWVDL